MRRKCYIWWNLKALESRFKEYDLSDDDEEEREESWFRINQGSTTDEKKLTHIHYIPFQRKTLQLNHS